METVDDRSRHRFFQKKRPMRFGRLDEDEIVDFVEVPFVQQELVERALLLCGQTCQVATG